MAPAYGVRMHVQYLSGHHILPEGQKMVLPVPAHKQPEMRLEVLRSLFLPEIPFFPDNQSKGRLILPLPFPVLQDHIFHLLF